MVPWFNGDMFQGCAATCSPTIAPTWPASAPAKSRPATPARSPTRTVLLMWPKRRVKTRTSATSRRSEPTRRVAASGTVTRRGVREASRKGMMRTKICLKAEIASAIA